MARKTEHITPTRAKPMFYKGSCFLSYCTLQDEGQSIKAKNSVYFTQPALPFTVNQVSLYLSVLLNLFELCPLVNITASQSFD